MTGGSDHLGATSVAQDQDFPPYDLLYSLADLFFKHINTWCPILHRRSTLDSLFSATSSLDDSDRILLHAIVATTLRFSQDPRLTDQNREHYHNLSKQRVLLYGLENSSVKALQALVSNADSQHKSSLFSLHKPTHHGYGFYIGVWHSRCLRY